MFGQLKRDNSDDPGKSIKVFLHWALSWWCMRVSPEEHYNKFKFANFNEEKLNTQERRLVAMVFSTTLVCLDSW